MDPIICLCFDPQSSRYSQLNDELLIIVVYHQLLLKKTQNQQDDISIYEYDLCIYHQVRTYINLWKRYGYHKPVLTPKWRRRTRITKNLNVIVKLVSSSLWLVNNGNNCGKLLGKVRGYAYLFERGSLMRYSHYLRSLT